MAAPKPGDKNYKGPVHEAVRSALGAFGVKVGYGQKPGPKGIPKAPAMTLDRMARMASNKRKIMTQVNKQKGTYSTYDPLSSISVKTSKPKAPKAKARRSAKKGR
jgi:hypothetical protein